MTDGKLNKKMVEANKNSREILAKTYYSIILAPVCALIVYGMSRRFMSDLMIGGFDSTFEIRILIYNLVDNGGKILTFFTILTMVFVTWFFIKTPNLKKTWSRIFISVGIIILLHSIIEFFVILLSGILLMDYNGTFTILFFVYLGISFIIGAYFFRIKCLKESAETRTMTPDQELEEGERQLGAVKVFYWFVIIILAILFVFILLSAESIGGMFTTTVTIFIGVYIVMYIIPLVGILKRRPWAFTFTRVALIITMIGFPMGTMLGLILMQRINHPKVKKYLNCRG